MKPTFSLINLVPLVLYGVVILLLIQNWSTPVSIIFASMPFPNVTLGSVLLIVYILASTATFLKLWDVNLQMRNQVKQWELRREKAEVKAETTSDQVQALESKIKTLEKALEQALSASTKERS